MHLPYGCLKTTIVKIVESTKIGLFAAGYFDVHFNCFVKSLWMAGRMTG